MQVGGVIKASMRVAMRDVAAAAILFSVSVAQAASEKAAAFYDNAARRYNQGDVPGAVIQLKNALQQDRHLLAAHVLLGKALVRSGDLKAAEAALEEARRQGASLGEIAAPLGQVYLSLGRPELVIERVPASGLPRAVQVEVLAQRGTAYIELRKPELAALSFAEARALDRNSAVPLIAEIPLLLMQGEKDRARTTAARAIELAPDNASAWNMHASVLHAALDSGGALKGYDRALSLDPAHADARIARAALLIDLQRHADAEKDLSILKTATPVEPRAAYLRALIAKHKGDEARVTEALNEAVRTIDALPVTWLSGREQLLMVGALSHHALGNWEKAREYLNAAVVRNSHNQAAKKLLAVIYFETRDYPRALAHLEGLQRSAPEDPQVLFLLGSVHLAQRRYASAAEFLEKAAARAASPEIVHKLAFSQVQLGRTEAGLATLEKAFAANPGDLQTGTRLSMLYMRNGEVQKAVNVGEAMVEREPGNLGALHFLGVVKASIAETAGARAAFTRILTKDPSFRPAALNLARLDASERRFDDARRRLGDMLGKQHDAHDVLFELGRVEHRAGRPSEAIRYLQKATVVQRRDIRPGLFLIDVHLGQHQFDQAVAAAKELSSKYPANLAAQLALARAHLAAGDQVNARGALQTATRLADLDSRMQVRIARMQLLASNTEGAHYSAQKALSGKPDDPAALALLVDIEMRRGDPARAEAALKALATKHPKRVETALAVANASMARGRYAAAAAAYRDALTLEQTTANALNVARAYISAGDVLKAASFLEGWVKSRPNDLAAIKALAEAQFRAGQLPQAQRNYARVLAAEPDDAMTLNNYANLLQRLSDPAAQSHAEKALKLVPHDPAYLDTLGWILAQRGQIEPALRYLREARVRSPDSGEIRFHLAFALAKAARRAEARDELLAALSGSRRVAVSDDVDRLRKELGV